MSVEVSERAALRVGAVALAMLLAAVVFVVAVWDRIEIGRRVRFQVYFQHVGALREGAPVVVAGTAIGRIESMALLPAGAPGPGGRRVVARLAIDARYQARIPVDTMVFVSSRGLLSERMLELGPGAGAGAPPIADGDQLIGIDPPSLDQTLQQTWARLEVARGFLADVTPAWAQLREALRTLGVTLDTSPLQAWRPLVSQAGEVIDHARLTVATLNTALGTGPDGGRTIDQAMTALDQTLSAATRAGVDLGPRWAALRTSLDQVTARLGTQVPVLVTRARVAMAAIDAAVQRIEPIRQAIVELVALAQKGTLMKILTDPEFPEDSRALGKLIKREPWKLLGHTDDNAAP